MSDYLGTIQNISTMRSMLDLHVFDDGILVAKGSLRSAVRAAAEAGVFRAGTAAVEAIVGTKTTGDRPMDRDALLAADPTATFIPFETVSELRLKKDWFGNGRLEIVGTDGSARRFDWKKLYNPFDEAEGVLRRAAPSLVRR